MFLAFDHHSTGDPVNRDLLKKTINVATSKIHNFWTNLIHGLWFWIIKLCLSVWCLILSNRQPGNLGIDLGD